MMSYIKEFFSSDSFMPHGHCYLWKPDILWTTVISDGIIAFSYFAIPLALFFFIRKKKRAPFVGVFILFSLFIVLCGVSHIVDIWTVWQPVYGILASVKAATALISFLTAVTLLPIIPKALNLKSPAELKEKNEQLIKEIEQRKKAEKIIQDQQAKLMYTSKMSALGEMAGGVAHEINNPLAIISSSVGNLEKALKKGILSNELVSELSIDIKDTVKRISNIVNGLRTVSREASGEQLEKALLVDILNDALGLCREKFKNNAVDTEIDFSNKVFNKEILCNRVQFSQVILNLLSNSFDAVESLNKKWIRIDATEDDKFIILKFLDSGNGIPMEIQEKVFTPFFTSKPVGKGTGLGLYISVSLLKKVGATLEIDNSDPHTCFVIKVPKSN